MVRRNEKMIPKKKVEGKVKRSEEVSKGGRILDLRTYVETESSKRKSSGLSRERWLSYPMLLPPIDGGNTDQEVEVLREGIPSVEVLTSLGEKYSSKPVNKRNAIRVKGSRVSLRGTLEKGKGGYSKKEEAKPAGKNAKVDRRRVNTLLWCAVGEGEKLFVGNAREEEGSGRRGEAARREGGSREGGEEGRQDGEKPVQQRPRNAEPIRERAHRSEKGQEDGASARGKIWKGAQRTELDWAAVRHSRGEGKR